MRSKKTENRMRISLTAAVLMGLVLCLPAAVAAGTVVRVHTVMGTFDVELFDKEAPLTVANFLAYVTRGDWDDSFFHRTLPGFVVQGGDPRGDGYGGPGYLVPCELSSRRFVRGAVGIATAGRDTGGSQLFVTQADTPHLDGRYTIFGELRRGSAVLDAIDVGDRILGVRRLD